MRALIPAILVMFTAACACDALESQVGQPLSQAVEELGTPHEAFDTDSGKRGFVWLRGDWGPITGLGNSNLYGGGAPSPEFTTADMQKERCRYVLFAKPTIDRPSAPEHWTVTDAKPVDDFFCL